MSAQTATLPRFDAWLPRGDGRTVLRRLRADDGPHFHAYRSNAALARFQGWSPMTPAAAAAFLAEMSGVCALQRDGWVQLGMAEPTSDALVGDVGLWLSADGLLAEIGFTVHQAYHGQGHATRAVQLALALVFAHSPALAVQAVSDVRNLPSLAVLRRAGFVPEAVRSAVFKGEACVEQVWRFPRPPAG